MTLPAAPEPSAVLHLDEVVDRLSLEPNPEGGWFRVLHEVAPSSGERACASFIHYLLAADAPIGWFHRTSAHTVHYFHQGAPMAVVTVDDHGQVERSVLGADRSVGQCLQVVVPGGRWKAFELVDGPWSLISEAVTPGWVPEDQESGTHELLGAVGPADRADLGRFVR